MATEDFEKLKDYTGNDFKVTKDDDEYTLSSGLYVDTGTADLHIPKNGEKPEKLVVYVGSEGLYRIYDLHTSEFDNSMFASETNQCFLTHDDFKKGHVSICNYIDENPDLGLIVVGDYYISLKTGDERASKPYGKNEGKNTQSHPQTEGPTNG